MREKEKERVKGGEAEKERLLQNALSYWFVTIIREKKERK